MKNYIYIGILLVIVYLILTKSKGKGSKTGVSSQDRNMKKSFTETDANNGLLKISKEVGKERAQLLERILRLETAHFTSGQYRQTGSAGMEEGKWKNLPTYTTIPFKDNHDGHIGKFIVWNSVYDFLNYLNDYIDRYNGNFARWNTTDENRQKEYISKVNSIKNRTIV
jgi:hypothetical protein